jgi:hypothetical protein
VKLTAFVNLSGHSDRLCVKIMRVGLTSSQAILLTKSAPKSSSALAFLRSRAVHRTIGTNTFTKLVTRARDGGHSSVTA